MKALRHSPEHKIRRYADDEVITPYGMMTSLQVHVRGIVAVKNEITGIVKGRKIDIRRGKGNETLFRNIGTVKNAEVVSNMADQMFNQYILGPKINTDGSSVNAEKKAKEVVDFIDNRNVVKKNGNKPVHNGSVANATSKHAPRPFVAKAAEVETNG